MDPRNRPAEPQDYKQECTEHAVHSQQQVGLESRKTAIKLHRSAQQNKTQECNGAHYYVLSRSQE
jgi:hypothetical protein